jgi:hypothetical protein
VPIETTDRRPVARIDTDVLVVGAGAAGVAASVTAARQGLKVLVLERYGFCGGGAVAGMSGTVCGLYEASQDAQAKPVQVVFGFADEFIRLMEQKQGLTPPVRYGKTFTRVHEPFVWREAGDHLLAQAGVRVLFHTVVTDVLMEGGERVAGVVAYTKQGKLEVRARLTIDASGDADVVAMAGLETTVGANGKVQNPTMIFRLQDVDVAAFMATYGPDTILGDETVRTIQALHAAKEYNLPRAKIFLFPTPRPDELLCNATRIIGRDGRELNPIVAEDLTEAEIEGRRQVREYERFIRDHISGCARSWLKDTGVQVGVRQSRQLKGKQTLANADVLGKTKSRTGVARSPWPIELHSGEKPRLEWLYNDFYEIPYECFVPVRGESLLVAGRCLSAEHEAMASARVTAQCFSYGHAIGHAAALVLNEKVSPREVEGTDVRQRLNRDGARLD